jgi:hypothetical protein
MTITHIAYLYNILAVKKAKSFMYLTCAIMVNPRVKKYQKRSGTPVKRHNA